MRAYEFIIENDMNQWQKDAVPGLKAISTLSSDRFYDLYRLGISFASAGQSESENEGEPTNPGQTNKGPAEEEGLTISYSDADEEIINTALKQHGLSGRNITKLGSQEPTDTMTTSPVANLGPVKRKS